MLHCFKKCSIKTYTSPQRREIFVEIIENSRSTLFSAGDIIELVKTCHAVALHIRWVDVPIVVSLETEEETTRFYNIMKACTAEPYDEAFY